MFNLKIFAFSILHLFVFSYCNDTKPKEIEKESKGQTSDINHISILDEIPLHIREIENLTILLGNSNPTHTIELKLLRVFGEEEESNFFLIYDCVEDDQGRVIIWGSDSNRGEGVYIYNPDGAYYKQLGRKGKGPGEYGTILGIYAKNKKIFISDFSSLRLNEYTIDNYSFERSIKFELWNNDTKLEFNNFVVPRNDGNYLLAFSDKTPKLGQLEIIHRAMDGVGNDVGGNDIVIPAGFAIDNGSKSGIPKPSLPLDFTENSITTLSKEDGLYVASTNEFLIKKYDADGVYKSAFYYPIIGMSFDLDEYVKGIPFIPKANQIRRAFNDINKELPNTLPVIEDLIIDDENRIWVAVPVDDKREKYEWWILQESGELIAKLLLPRNQRIFDIKNGYLYAKKDNGKRPGYLYSGNGSDPSDAEYIVKYQIEFTEN